MIFSLKQASIYAELVKKEGQPSTIAPQPISFD